MRVGPLAVLALSLLLISTFSPAVAGATTGGSAHSIPTARDRPEIPRAAQPPARQYSLLPNYYEYFTINSYASGTQLKFTISASNTVDVYVMDSTQFSEFVSNGAISTLYHRAASSLDGSFELPSSGQYDLVVNNDLARTTVYFDVNYATVPVDIYKLSSAAPVPTGISDYGEEKAGGGLLPYKQEMTAVTASAVINGLAAYNSSAPSGASPYGASLQLNVMLRVNTTKGQYVYWIQNVLSLYTNNDSAYFLDNVWNSSSEGAVLNPSMISGKGSVLPYHDQNFYVYAADEFSYGPPLSVKFPVEVAYSGESVTVSFGYQEASNGRPVSGQANTYDVATIDEGQPVQGAAIVVSGYELVPSGNFFDAELVFGGQCCGAITTFTSMDATLGLSYALTNGDVVVPNSVYEFGSDTAEGAFGLQTNRVGNEFKVGLGTIDFAADYVTVPVVPVRLTFSYSTSDGTSMAAAPALTYISNGTDVTAEVGRTATTFNVDEGTEWSITSVVAGSNGERWAVAGKANGTAATDQTYPLTYYHQYLVPVAYAVKGGGQPEAPSLQATSFNAGFAAAISSQNASYWLDSGSPWSTTNPLGGSSPSQRWQAADGTSGTVSSGLAIDPVYAEQYLVTVDYQVVGGGTPGEMSITGIQFGAQTQISINQSDDTFWLDSGTSFALNSPAPVPGTSERWATNSTMGGVVSTALTASLTFYHQFYVNVQSSGSEGTSVAPQSGWFDAGSTIALNSSATSSWEFTAWIGSGPDSYSGNASSTSVVVGGPTNETAVFYPGIQLEASQGGSVSYLLGSATGAVGPGETVVLYAPAGTEAVVTAQPSLLQSFERWSGSANGSQVSIVVDLESPSQVTATFGLDYGELGLIAGALALVVALVVLVVRGRGRG